MLHLLLGSSLILLQLQAQEIPVSEKRELHKLNTILETVPFLADVVQDKSPVPDPNTQKKLQKDIRRLLKDTYRKGDLPSLARQLLLVESKTENDAGSQFAFLMEAYDIAVKGGAFDLAFSAIDRLDEAFDLSKGAKTALEMKFNILDKARKTARTLKAAQFVAESYLDLAHKATATGRLEEAELAARNAATSSKRARSRAIPAFATELKKDIGEIKRDKQMADKLDRKAPIDIGNHFLNLKSGRHICFVETDWEEGLEYLLWSGEDRLKGAAGLELKEPNSVEAFASVTEARFDAAEKASSSFNKRRYASRARYLFQQSRYLPSENDFENAAERLEKDYDDRKANQTVGMYLAFVEGEFEGAMQYLAKASSSTLRKLAQHEMDPKHVDTPEKQIGMGDEWVKAARSFRPLTPIFYERASQWYEKAWPKVEPVWKDNLRERGKALATSRPRGTPKTDLPNGWKQSRAYGGTVPQRDGTVARTGSHSLKMMPPVGAYSILSSTLIPVTDGEEVEVTAYVRSEGTENGLDSLYVRFYDAGLGKLKTQTVLIPVDLPFWKPVSFKTQIPPNTARAEVGMGVYSKKGNVWVDDVSLSIDGGENLVQNPSFEK